MIVELSRLREGPQRLTGEESPAILELEADSGINPLTPIRYEVQAELTPGELVVRGRLSMGMAADCSRCGKHLELEVRVPDFVAVREYRDVTESIDLTPEMREDIILAFPNYPVCSAVCRGLCPRCGADLNDGPCSCRPPEGDRVWDALDQIKKKTE